MTARWPTCHIGSCPRHQACMYTPCRAEHVHSTMTGTMRLEGDNLVGSVVDTFGYVQHITGTPAPGGWTLAVRVVVPEEFRLAWETEAP
jgi:hypothetical protein